MRYFVTFGHASPGLFVNHFLQTTDGIPMLLESRTKRKARFSVGPWGEHKSTTRRGTRKSAVFLRWPCNRQPPGNSGYACNHPYASGCAVSRTHPRKRQMTRWQCNCWKKSSRFWLTKCTVNQRLAAYWSLPFRIRTQWANGNFGEPRDGNKRPLNKKPGEGPGLCKRIVLQTLPYT